MRLNHLALATLVAAMPVAAASAAVVITEVHPTGSNTTTYAADFFELTNTGTATVDLTGWKMDDNSFALASAVAIRGLTSLPAGASAVFLENGTSGATDAATASAFATAWFGATPPANLLIGFYGGSGVGLSGTAGDGVVVFDASGSVVSGVQFGVATTGVTFDNAAGIGSTSAPYPTLATLSVSGVNGAFVSPAGETGSPGTASVPEPASLAAIAVGALGLLKRRR